MERHNQMCYAHRLENRDGNGPMNMIARIVLAMWLVGVDMEVSQVTIPLRRAKRLRDAQ
jgi:hypothetical protein